MPLVNTDRYHKSPLLFYRSSEAEEVVEGFSAVLGTCSETWAERDAEEEHFFALRITPSRLIYLDACVVR